MTNRRCAALFALLSALSLPAVAAVRGESNTVRGSPSASALDAALPDRRRLSPKSPKERECTLSEKADNQIKFSCKTKTDDKETDTKIKDKIEYKVYSDSDGASVVVKYENEVKVEKEKTKTKTEYRILFDKIVEFVPSSEDGAYSFEDGDEQVQVLQLGDWGDFSDIVTSDDGVVSFFHLTSPDGMVEFNFTISRAAAGEMISANKMKIDFRLTGWEWEQNNTNVALFCLVESTQKVKVHGKKAKKGKAEDVTIPFGQAVDDTGISTFGEYTWASSAEATIVETADEDVAVASNGDEDGDNSTIVAQSTSTIDVIATSPELDEESDVQIIAFTFTGENGASEIYWDPEAGIGYESGAFHAAARAAAMIAGVAGAAFWLLFA